MEITLPGFLLGCFSVTAVYHFFLFMFYKKNYPALYFALITTGSTILTLIKPTDWYYKEKAILLIFVMVPLCYLEFTRSMYTEEYIGLKSRFLTLFFRGYIFLAAILYIVIPKSFLIIHIKKFQIGSFVMNSCMILFMFVQLIRASRKKKSDARIILAGYLILFITALSIYMIPSNMMVKSNPIGALGILTLYSYTLARRYSNGYHTCEVIVQERTEQLKENNEELIHLLNYDVLTGVYTRRFIMDKFFEIFKEYKLEDDTFAVIALDVDHFKKVNDQYGHAKGDEVLVKMSSVLQKNIRKSDYVGRTGGEEFLIILPSATLNDGVRIAEELRIKVNELCFSSDEGAEFQVTCSFGVAAYKEDMKDYDVLLKKTDQLLYKAKEQGRNRICS